MTEAQFLEDVKEALELEDREVHMDDCFREYEEWDSLTFLALTTLLSSQYGVSVGIDAFNSINTWGDLYSYVTQ